jgi:tetratricopeptide (TPR) repeat protein
MEYTRNTFNSNGKKTICLNMIVKNEAHIIASTLQNILDHMPIDYWVISDTGSTDNTIDIITAFFREKNIPGEIFLDAWKDFGHNRTKMLEHAYNKTDYVFIFDADDLICGSAILPLGSNILTKDAYYIPFENPISYHRLILASNRMRWKYVGVLHEYIVNIDPIRSEEYLSGDYYINSRRLGNRSKNPNKYLDDAITLENAFQMETVDIHLKNRYAYYCAQSYRDAGKHEKAIEWYEKTLTLDYSTQYKYSACIRAGDCYMYLNNPDGAIKIWGKAYEYDKERPEAISNIMEYYYKNGVHFMVTALYNQFKSRIDFNITSEQSKYKVFLDYSKYHNIHYYNSISGYYSGDFLSAYEACKYLLLHNTNKVYMENVVSNLKYYREQFKQDVYVDTLIQFFIGYLNHAQKPLHIKTQIWDFSKEMIKTKYSDKYDDIERIIHSNTQHNVIKSNTYKASNKILIYTGWMTHLWNQSHVNDKALGGSEKAVVYLSQQFPTTYDIIISGDVEEGSFNNITYVHQNNLQSILDKTEFHTVIISRYICFLERFKNIKTNKLLLSLHDTDIIKCDFTIDIPSVIHKYINHIDNVIVLTNYHKSVISSKYPLLNDKFIIINNGIDVDGIAEVDEPDSNMNKNIHGREKIPNKFVYTSCSYRGLNTLLNMWPNILSVLPDATLDISSYDTFPKNEDDVRMLNIINQHSSSITHHGKLNKRDLYNMISKAEYWFYPTHFHETSCITALEMLLNNTICIYYPIGALVDTIGDYGITVNGDNAVDTIVNLSTSKKALLRKNGREYALSCSWKNRYASWEKVIGLDCIDSSYADCTDGNKTKWCFYYHNFTIETVEQFINNQVNHDGGNYDILISNNKDEIMRWQPDKLSFVLSIFDESIIHSLSTNDNHKNCEISILQTEPLNLSWWFNTILDNHSKYPYVKIYDYSKSNIKILNQHNITNCEYLPYNIQLYEANKLTKFLSENRNNGENELYDFGFIFDWKSLPVEKQHIIKPPRRSKVIDFLRNSGFKVNIIAGYDDDRDIELSKCKLILNIHGQLGLNHNPSPTECSNIFEHVRCDRLLETGYTVLTETSYELDHEFINKYPNLKIINYADFFNIDIITRIINESVTNVVTNVVSESVIEVVADDSIYNKTIYNKNKVDSEYDDTNNSMLQYGQLYNTDKVTHHEYHKYYEPVLKPFYNSYGSIVEIGLGTGVSLPMWKNLFKYAHIYGVDKEYENRGDDRHTIYKADQSNVNDLNNLKKSLTDKNVFFINDDGSHIPEHQLLSFNTLFPIVAEGGFYIIEDIETSYWTRGECYGYKTNYGYKHPNSMIEIFKEAADIINREFIVDKTRLSNKIQHYDYIESITFARNCIIVKKNYNANRDYRFKHFI